MDTQARHPHCKRASKMALSFILTLLLLNLACVSAFNVVSTEQDLRYLLSTVTRRRGKDAIPTLPKNEPATFFGYSMHFHKERSGDASIILGAPKRTDPEKPTSQIFGTDSGYSSLQAQGEINYCSVSKSLFHGLRTPYRNCNSFYPDDKRKGDSFGASLSFKKDNGMGCAYSRIKNCGSSFYSPGYCFRASHAGKRWGSPKPIADFECPVTGIDIMFVLDGSQSIGGDNFETVKDWVLAVIKNFNIDTGVNRVGVIQYSHFYDGWPLDDQPFIATEVALGEVRKFRKFRELLRDVRLQNYTTYTSHALNKTVMDFQASERFSDPSIKMVMILLTDGKSKDEEHLAYSADYVRSFGIRTYAVGVADAVQRELRLIATGDINSNRRVYEVDDFNALSGIVKSLQEDIMKSVLESAASATDSETNRLSMAQTGISMKYSEKRVKVPGHRLSRSKRTARAMVEH